MITIQPCDSSHISDIQTLALAIWPFTFQHILSAEQIHYMMDMMYSTAALTSQMDEQQHKYLLLQADDQPLGYLSYQSNYHQQPITKIHKIYLLPSAQGKGLGRHFFESVTAIARSNGDLKLSLNVNRNNTALGFYQKIGFSIVGQEDIPIGNGYLMEDYILEKEII